MFRCALAPASQNSVRKWKRWAFGSASGQCLTSVATVTAVATKLISDKLVNQNYMFAATAIAFITGLPLLAFPRVISVSIAQMGVATSFLYIAFSLFPTFHLIGGIIFPTILSLTVIVFIVLFFSGIKSIYKICDTSDLILSAFLYIIFIFLWVNIAINAWRA